MAWIKVQDYAKKYKVTPMAVYKKIKRNKIRVKKIKGVNHVEDIDNDVNTQINNEVPLTAQEEKINLEWDKIQSDERKLKIELQKEKLKNLQQDTILKQLKQQSVKEYYRREFSQQVFQCLTDSFSDLKNYLIELKLDKEQNQKLKLVFKKTIDKFRKKLSDNLKKKQKEQEDKPDEVE